MASTDSNYARIVALETKLDLFISKSKLPKDGTETSAFSADSLLPIQNPGEDVKFIKASRLFSNISVWDGYFLFKKAGNSQPYPQIGDIILGRGIGTFYGGENIYGEVVNDIPTGHGSDSDIKLFTSYP